MILTPRTLAKFLPLFIALIAAPVFGAIAGKSEQKKTAWEKFDEKVSLFHFSEYATGAFDGYAQGYIPAPDSTPGGSADDPNRGANYDPTTGNFAAGQPAYVFNLEGLSYKISNNWSANAWLMWMVNLPARGSAVRGVFLDPRLFVRRNNLASWFNTSRFDLWMGPGISPGSLQTNKIMELGVATQWSKQARFSDSFGGAFTFSQLANFRYRLYFGAGNGERFRFDSVTEFSWNMTAWMRTVHRFGFRMGYNLDQGGFNSSNGYNGTYPIIQNGLEINVTSWMTIAPLINNYAFVLPTTSNVFGTLELVLAPF